MENSGYDSIHVCVVVPWQIWWEMWDFKVVFPLESQTWWHWHSSERHDIVIKCSKWSGSVKGNPSFYVPQCLSFLSPLIFTVHLFQFSFIPVSRRLETQRRTQTHPLKMNCSDLLHHSLSFSPLDCWSLQETAADSKSGWQTRSGGLLLISADWLSATHVPIGRWRIFQYFVAY